MGGVKPQQRRRIPEVEVILLSADVLCNWCNRITSSRVQAKLDQVGNMTGFGVSGGFHCGHDGVYDSKGWVPCIV